MLLTTATATISRHGNLSSTLTKHGYLRAGLFTGMLLIRLKNEFMTKVHLLLLSVSFLLYAPFQTAMYGASVSLPQENTASLLPLNSQLWVSEFVKLTPKKFRTVTGKNMTLLEKISLKINQAKMKRYLKNHPDLLVTDYIKTNERGNKKFSLLWYSIGLLGPLLVLLLISAVTATIGVGLIIAILAAPIATAYITKRSKIEKLSVWAGVGTLLSLALSLGAILFATWFI